MKSGGEHRRGRSMGSTAPRSEKDEDLAMFHEMKRREKHHFLHPSPDDLDVSLSSKFGGMGAPAAKKVGNDLLNSDADKNDYDWLLTPPGTPLFPSLDQEAAAIAVIASQTALHNGSAAAAATNASKLSNSPVDPSPKGTRANPSPRRPGSTTPNGISRSRSTPHNSIPTVSVVRSSNPTSSGTRPSTPTSSSTRPSTPTAKSSTTPSLRASTPNLKLTISASSKSSTSSTPTGTRPSTPSTRSSTPPVRPSTPGARSSTPNSKPSTPTMRRSLSGSRISSPATTRGGPSPKRTTSSRGNSPSAKRITPIITTVAGMCSEAPPNLRTTMTERPSSTPKSSSNRSRPVFESGHNSDAMDISGRGRRRPRSPSVSRSFSSSSSQDQRTSSQTSRGSVVSSSYDDFSEVSRPSIGSSRSSTSKWHASGQEDMGGGKGSMQSKRVSKSSVVSRDTSGLGGTPSKKSLDPNKWQGDAYQHSPNSYRHLMSSSPGSPFYGTRANSLLLRPGSAMNSSVTTSSNASSEHGTTVAPDTEGSERDDDDLISWDSYGRRMSPSPRERHADILMLDKDDEKLSTWQDSLYDKVNHNELLTSYKPGVQSTLESEVTSFYESDGIASLEMLEQLGLMGEVYNVQKVIPGSKPLQRRASNIEESKIPRLRTGDVNGHSKVGYSLDHEVQGHSPLEAMKLEKQKSLDVLKASRRYDSELAKKDGEKLLNAKETKLPNSEIQAACLFVRDFKVGVAPPPHTQEGAVHLPHSSPALTEGATNPLRMDEPGSVSRSKEFGSLRNSRSLTSKQPKSAGRESTSMQIQSKVMPSVHQRGKAESPKPMAAESQDDRSVKDSGIQDVYEDGTASALSVLVGVMERIKQESSLPKYLDVESQGLTASTPRSTASFENDTKPLNSQLPESGYGLSYEEIHAMDEVDTPELHDLGDDDFLYEGGKDEIEFLENLGKFTVLKENVSTVKENVSDMGLNNSMSFGSPQGNSRLTKELVDVTTIGVDESDEFPTGCIVPEVEGDQEEEVVSRIADLPDIFYGESRSKAEDWPQILKSTCDARVLVKEAHSEMDVDDTHFSDGVNQDSSVSLDGKGDELPGSARVCLHPNEVEISLEPVYVSHACERESLPPSPQDIVPASERYGEFVHQAHGVCVQLHELEDEEDIHSMAPDAEGVSQCLEATDNGTDVEKFLHNAHEVSEHLEEDVCFMTSDVPLVPGGVSQNPKAEDMEAEGEELLHNAHDTPKHLEEEDICSMAIDVPHVTLEEVSRCSGSADRETDGEELLHNAHGVSVQPEVEGVSRIEADVPHHCETVMKDLEAGDCESFHEEVLQDSEDSVHPEEEAICSMAVDVTDLPGGRDHCQTLLEEELLQNSKDFVHPVEENILSMAVYASHIFEERSCYPGASDTETYGKDLLENTDGSFVISEEGKICSMVLEVSHVLGGVSPHHEAVQNETSKGELLCKTHGVSVHSEEEDIDSMAGSSPRPQEEVNVSLGETKCGSIDHELLEITSAVDENDEKEDVRVGAEDAPCLLKNLPHQETGERDVAGFSDTVLGGCSHPLGEKICLPLDQHLESEGLLAPPHSKENWVVEKDTSDGGDLPGVSFAVTDGRPWDVVSSADCGIVGLRLDCVKDSHLNDITEGRAVTEVHDYFPSNAHYLKKELGSGNVLEKNEEYEAGLKVVPALGSEVVGGVGSYWVDNQADGSEVSERCGVVPLKNLDPVKILSGNDASLLENAPELLSLNGTDLAGKSDVVEHPKERKTLTFLREPLELIHPQDQESREFHEVIYTVQDHAKEDICTLDPDSNECGEFLDYSGGSTAGDYTYSPGDTGELLSLPVEQAELCGVESDDSLIKHLQVAEPQTVMYSGTEAEDSVEEDSGEDNLRVQRNVSMDNSLVGSQENHSVIAVESSGIGPMVESRSSLFSSEDNIKVSLFSSEDNTKVSEVLSKPKERSRFLGPTTEIRSASSLCAALEEQLAGLIQKIDSAIEESSKPFMIGQQEMIPTKDKHSSRASDALWDQEAEDSVEPVRSSQEEDLLDMLWAEDDDSSFSEGSREDEHSHVHDPCLMTEKISNKDGISGQVNGEIRLSRSSDSGLTAYSNGHTNGMMEETVKSRACMVTGVEEEPLYPGNSFVEASRYENGESDISHVSQYVLETTSGCNGHDLSSVNEVEKVYNEAHQEELSLRTNCRGGGIHNADEVLSAEENICLGDLGYLGASRSREQPQCSTAEPHIEFSEGNDDLKQGDCEDEVPEVVSPEVTEVICSNQKASNELPHHESRMSSITLDDERQRSTLETHGDEEEPHGVYKMKVNEVNLRMEECLILMPVNVQASEDASSHADKFESDVLQVCSDKADREELAGASKAPNHVIGEEPLQKGASCDILLQQEQELGPVEPEDLSSSNLVENGQILRAGLSKEFAYQEFMDYDPETSLSVLDADHNQEAQGVLNVLLENTSENESGSLGCMISTSAALDASEGLPSIVTRDEIDLCGKSISTNSPRTAKRDLLQNASERESAVYDHFSVRAGDPEEQFSSVSTEIEDEPKRQLELERSLAIYDDISVRSVCGDESAINSDIQLRAGELEEELPSVAGLDKDEESKSQQGQFERGPAVYDDTSRRGELVNELSSFLTKAKLDEHETEQEHSKGDLAYTDDVVLRGNELEEEKSALLARDKEEERELHWAMQSNIVSSNGTVQTRPETEIEYGKLEISQEGKMEGHLGRPICGNPESSPCVREVLAEETHSLTSQDAVPICENESCRADERSWGVEEDRDKDQEPSIHSPIARVDNHSEGVNQIVEGKAPDATEVLNLEVDKEVRRAESLTLGKQDITREDAWSEFSGVDCSSSGRQGADMGESGLKRDGGIAPEAGEVDHGNSRGNLSGIQNQTAKKLPMNKAKSVRTISLSSISHSEFPFKGHLSPEAAAQTQKSFDYTNVTDSSPETLQWDSDTPVTDTALTSKSSPTTVSRSMTLAEAADTILYCSSLMHTIVYRAAALAIEKEELAALVSTPANNSEMLNFSGIPEVDNRDTHDSGGGEAGKCQGQGNGTGPTSVRRALSYIGQQAGSLSPSETCLQSPMNQMIEKDVQTPDLTSPKDQRLPIFNSPQKNASPEKDVESMAHTVVEVSPKKEGAPIKKPVKAKCGCTIM